MIRHFYHIDLLSAGLTRYAILAESVANSGIACVLLGVSRKHLLQYNIWGFTDGKTVKNKFKTMEEIPASTPLSDKISKDLKKRGFRFVGSTIIYAFLQAIGVVDDHLTGCFRYNK
jgi:DNA-3-methyladenine glycosylase I